MIRQLPKVGVGGLLFEVDLLKCELRQAENKNNRIDFDELIETPNCYKIQFDPVTQNSFKGTLYEFRNRNDIQLIKLPFLEELDPVGFYEIINRWRELYPQAVLLQQFPFRLTIKEFKNVVNVLSVKPKAIKKTLLTKKRIRKSGRLNR